MVRAPSRGIASNGVNPTGSSHNTPAVSRSEDNLEPSRRSNSLGYGLFNERPERGRNSNYSNSPQLRGRIQFYPIDKQDDQMTRMNAAREFVRKMIYAVQMYNHRINSRSLAEAVYRRFGVKMKIPNIVRVPDYNGWIFHQNSTKCASDGNLLLSTDVSILTMHLYFHIFNGIKIYFAIGTLEYWVLRIAQLRVFLGSPFKRERERGSLPFA